MMDGGYFPLNLEAVFSDFIGRRYGLIKAFTLDYESFKHKCHSEMGHLCLYGFPNGDWELTLPAEEVPPELPEPALGVNVVMDGMTELEHLAMVVDLSDAWLLSVAFYFGARLGFDEADRKQLFRMINEVPTVFDVVKASIRAAKNQAETSKIEQIFRGFKGRRSGLIKALTVDVEKFFQQCDPEKENLCLYGLRSKCWEVGWNKQIPHEQPEPALGINFARDESTERDWLALVAIHSDVWLFSVAFYYGARYGFNRADREHLFNMINDLPTLFEVVTGAAKRQMKDKQPTVTNHRASKLKSKLAGDVTGATSRQMMDITTNGHKPLYQ